MSTHFNVTMDVEDMQGKAVLVFLNPKNPQRDNLIHAWQVLNGSAGATKSFDYEAIISTGVIHDGEKAGNTITSGGQVLVPGQPYSVTSPSGLSPELQLAYTSPAQVKLPPEPGGVIDQTTPFVQFSSQ